MSVEEQAGDFASNTSEKEFCPLFLYFWLPAGKEAFGFKNWQNAHLAVGKGYYDDLYIPIALQFPKRLKQVKFPIENVTKEFVIKFFDDKEEQKKLSS